jgi:hypothetical protein
VGLGDYAGRQQWPANSLAAAGLPDRANLGLCLRWAATAAEMRAFAEVAPAWRREVLMRFGASVSNAISASGDLMALPIPDLARPALADAVIWDDVPTIFGFAVLAPPDDAGERRPMDPAEARLVYHWLNSDLRGVLPAKDAPLAALRCHIGQPAPVSLPGSGVAGMLRISAGARLVSGEPSHTGLDREARFRRELDDVARVIAKVGLIVAHWSALKAADMRPTFC